LNIPQSSQEAMKIDLHVHTSDRSQCAKSDEIEMIEASIRQGLHAIAITDHHRLVPQARLTELNEKFAPFQIYHGVEIFADQEDWLVLGLQDLKLEREDWTYSDLHKFVRSQGGLLVLAHPYRYHNDVSVNLKQFPPDAIEVRSNNIRAENMVKIQQLAEALKLPTLSNSDAHHTSSLGKYYNNFKAPALSETTVLEQIRSSALR
jgi:predicted metal-dependent phosphoesterase TrpH